MTSNIVKVQRKSITRYIHAAYNPVLDNQSTSKLPMYWYDKVSSTMDRVLPYLLSVTTVNYTTGKRHCTKH